MTALVPMCFAVTEWNVGWDYKGDGCGGPVRLKVFKNVPRVPTDDDPLRFETVYAVDLVCDTEEQARAIATELGFLRPL